MTQQFMVEGACPKCQRAESWSVWIGKSGEPMGTCHRALCSYGTRPIGTVIGILPPKKKEPRYYTRPLEPLTEDQYAMIYERFGLDGKEITYNEIDDRFILGVYGPVGYNRRGYIAYSLSGAIPKSLTYNEKPEEPWMHWAKGMLSASVVVEDWFSAEKVACARADGIAIMGTNLTQAMVTEIAAAANGPTFLAFDRDAFGKSVGYIAKYREQFPLGLYAWSLVKDLKYETTERIKEALDGNYDFSRDVSQQRCL